MAWTLSACGTRMCTGPPESGRGGGVVAIFVNRMLRGEQPVINGNGTQTRDYVYVATSSGKPECPLLSRERRVQRGHRRRDRCQRALPHIRTHTDPVRGKTRRSQEREQLGACSTQEDHPELGWSVSMPLEEGLRRTVEYFRTHGTMADKGRHIDLEKFFAGDRISIARAISVVENDSPGARRPAAGGIPETGRGYRIAITGPPGAGRAHHQ